MSKKSLIQNRTYSLKLNERQLGVLQNALELFSRIGMGQFSQVKWTLLMSSSNAEHKMSVEQSNLLEDMLTQAQICYTPERHPGAYWSISSKEIGDCFRVAWDIQQVVRHRLSWDRLKREKGPNAKRGITVDFDEPIKYGAEPLPEIIGNL